MTTNYTPPRIADLPDDDKPREKAIKHGIDSLSDTELLAIVLGSGLPGKSVIDLSREILSSCGGDLSTLSRLSIREMTRKFLGVGPAKAVGIAAAIALGGRCARISTQDAMPQIKCSEDVYRLMSHDMSRLDHEEFRILILNRSSRVKAIETISSGGTAATVVDIKLLVKRAIDALADAIILVHNHPSGNLNPSTQDDALTKKITDATKLMDIRVLDHVIVASTGYYSYQDNGRL